MEHLDTGTLGNWYANREMPLPANLRRLAVIAPDDAPGLTELRQRLAQRPLQTLECDHFAAGFNEAGKLSLASAFEQIRQRHAGQPYDLVLLLEGRPDALGIAESNGLIPEQVSRMPVPVWTAIGEDDANTELGDVANRVFSSPAALIAALPLPGPVQPKPAAASSASTVSSAPALSLVTLAGAASLNNLPTYAMPPAAAAPAYGRVHPLVLCAAGAVIIACLTAIAAMLGWLPAPQLAAAPTPGRAAVVTSVPAAPTPATVLRAPEAPAAAVPEPVPEPASAPSTPQSSSAAEGAVLAAAAVGAAGVIGSAPRSQVASPAVKRAKQPPRRRSQQAPAYAQGSGQVGSVEVPVVEFVGTKTREQVIAEMVAARRAANRQPGNNSTFPGFGSAAARR